MPIVAGDIMLKKSDGRAISKAIHLSQGVAGLGGLRSTGPSEFTHAAIASSAHTVIEMGGHGLLEHGLPTTNAQFDYAVFRSVDASIAAGVTTTAIMMLEIAAANKGVASYTILGALKSLFKSGRMKPGTGDVASLMIDKMFGDKGAAFFCSGFVVLCYQIVCSQNGILAPWAQTAFPVQEAGGLFSLQSTNYQPSFLYKTVAASPAFNAVGMFKGETYQGPVV